MRTIITINDVLTDAKRIIEVRQEHRELYEIEIEGLSDVNSMKVLTIADIKGGVYYLTKEIAQKYLIKIENLDI